VNALDEFFKGTFNSSGNLVGKSVFFELVDMLSKNFYDWYARSKFPLMPKNPLQLSFKKKVLDNEISIRGLLARDYGYNLLRSSDEKSLDAAALLSAPVERGANNIRSSALRLPNNLAPFGSPNFFTHKSIFPQRSLHDGVKAIENMPSIQDLLGVDSYVVGSPEQQRAQLFIGYILNAGAASESFQIPERPSSTGSNFRVEVCTPRDLSGERKCATIRTNKEYDDMVAYFHGNSAYREHRSNVRNTSILRANNTEPIYRAYQNRIKNRSENSQVELERYMAHEGLDEQYYEELKTKSMADVNLETLRAINKLVYFTHKAHRDNEQIKIILSGLVAVVTKLASVTQGTMSMRSIGTAIENECWKDPSKKACTDPMSALMPDINM
jgi:hypothetical protein